MSLQRWRDLAVVLLALEALIFNLIGLLLFYFAIRGLRWSVRAVHTHAPRVQEFLRKTAHTTDRIGQRVVTPLISASAGMAGVRRWLLILFSIRSCSN